MFFVKSIRQITVFIVCCKKQQLFFKPLVIKYDSKSYGFVQTDIRS